LQHTIAQSDQGAQIKETDHGQVVWTESMPREASWEDLNTRERDPTTRVKYNDDQ
jgi:hypothetical protein